MGAIVVIVSHPSQSAASKKGASPLGGLSVAPALNPTWPCTSNPPRIDSFPNGVLGLGQDPFPAQLACGPGMGALSPPSGPCEEAVLASPGPHPRSLGILPRKATTSDLVMNPKTGAIMHPPDLSLLFS